MAKRTLGIGSVLADASVSDIPYAIWRAQVTQRLGQLVIEQEHLRGLLAHLEVPANGQPEPSTTPLIPDSGREVLPTPKRRTWTPEAREAQRRRMKAHWRKQKAK